MKRKISLYLPFIIVILCTIYFVIESEEEKKYNNLNTEMIAFLKENQMIDNDVFGILNIPGTNILYPIINMMNYENLTDDEVLSYLFNNYNYNNYYSEENQVFLQTILGHNRKNLANPPLLLDETDVLFGQLLSFYHLDFVKENQILYYTTDKTYKYQIFSVAFLEIENNLTPTDMTDEEKLEHIDKLKDYSLYDFDIDVNENDHIITLSTCTRYYGNRTDIVFTVSFKLIDFFNEDLVDVIENEDRLYLDLD